MSAQTHNPGRNDNNIVQAMHVRLKAYSDSHFYQDKWDPDTNYSYESHIILLSLWEQDCRLSESKHHLQYAQWSWVISQCQKITFILLSRKMMVFTSSIVTLHTGIQGNTGWRLLVNWSPRNQSRLHFALIDPLGQFPGIWLSQRRHPILP